MNAHFDEKIATGEPLNLVRRRVEQQQQHLSVTSDEIEMYMIGRRKFHCSLVQ